ncbi:MAG: OsmC family protein [Salinimicrobium sediminis]|uniref:Osmotically inducible protein OsmC n=1 Tax=Salinimicrobium sediminis TaxID=1343891 RepID=A0A285X453_9FLAO|nr:OsmC family protein [Salinimicrobium sediminis]MDX1604010.1 OsmC family protein [Salinimicrobium sediminis]MDX1752104.1 OsmC family protein [Salinimicrobium sediminis]SOC80140.1 osmotically inducible protein OsmC [Salinimicrobium sediminis]
MKRKATAVWNGTLKEGKGNLSTQSEVLNKTPYSFNTRFENEKGTNPEELVGAAHAGCFTMQLSANLSKEGFSPVTLETEATITLEDGSITKSHLVLKAKVPGVSQEKFEELVKHAKENCPISKLLNTEISLESTLNG